MPFKTCPFPVSCLCDTPIKTTLRECIEDRQDPRGHQTRSWRAGVLQSLAPTCLNTPASVPSKTVISCSRCVWLGLELNSAGHWSSRTGLGDPWLRPFHKRWHINIRFLLPRHVQRSLSTLNTTTEVPLSKTPNPRLLPGHRGVCGAIASGVCVHFGWVKCRASISKDGSPYLATLHFKTG